MVWSKTPQSKVNISGFCLLSKFLSYSLHKHDKEQDPRPHHQSSLRSNSIFFSDCAKIYFYFILSQVFKITKMSIYKLHRPKKGLAFIINNLHNEQKATREDVKKLKAMFNRINVQVDSIKINQDKNELTTIAAELKTKDMSSYNLCFLVVLSHGIQGDKIVCMNGKEQSTFDIEFFVENLSGNKSMNGFPKIFIFDFCRGNDVNLGYMKATPSSRIPFGSDVFIAFATTKGYASATGKAGSPFINSFCDCIEKSFDKEPFISIFQEVQNVTSKTVTSVYEPTKGSIIDAMQVPESRSTLRKQLFLLDKG